MKKVLLPLIVAAALSVGAYFVFFQGDRTTTTDSPGKSGEEQVTFAPDDTIPFGDPPDEEALEREQLLMEHARPENYVVVEYEHRRNILGETVVEGTLENQAELTTYKDLQMMLYFDDAEGMPLDSASEVVFETIMPQKQTTFRLKHKGPRKAKGVRLRLHNAQIVEFE